MRLSVVGVAALLAAVAATPVLATTSHAARKKKAPMSVPDCAHFSRARMAGIIHAGSLEYLGKTNGLPNACTYKSPRVRGQYSDLLTVEVAAKPEAEFVASERVAKQDAISGKAIFKVVPVSGAAMYLESRVETAPAKPCEPGFEVPIFGPPLCSAAPIWLMIEVNSYGALKPHGPKAFVSVDLAGEFGIQEDRVIALNEQILSGQIR